MLLLDRKVGQIIVIGDKVHITLLEIAKFRCKIKVGLGCFSDSDFKSVTMFIDECEDVCINDIVEIACQPKSNVIVRFKINAPRDIPIFRSELLGGTRD